MLSPEGWKTETDLDRGRLYGEGGWDEKPPRLCWGVRVDDLRREAHTGPPPPSTVGEGTGTARPVEDRVLTSDDRVGRRRDMAGPVHPTTGGRPRPLALRRTRVIVPHQPLDRRGRS